MKSSAAMRTFVATQRESYQGLLSGLDVRGQLTGRAAVHQSRYLWAKTMLPGYILTMLGDRMEMAHSIEGRVPFLDHQLHALVQDKLRGRTLAAIPFFDQKKVVGLLGAAPHG